MTATAQRTPFTRGLAVLGTAALIAGCTAMPDRQAIETDEQSIVESQRTSWESTPPVVYRDYEQPMNIIQPGCMPAEVYDQTVSFDLKSSVTVADFSRLLKAYDVQTAISNDEVAEKLIRIPYYDGTFGDFIATLSENSNLSFSYRNGTLIISDTNPYVVRIPQNDALAEKIATSLEELGAEEISLSPDSGSVSYKASMQNQAQIHQYLNRLSTNSAIVNMQLAVINVELSRERDQGLDWSSLNAVIGEADLLAEASEVVTEGVAGRLNGSSLALEAAEGNVSLSGVINMLSTYGETQTTQNLTVKTLSGIEVNLRSGQTIPYIEEQTLSSSDNSDNTLSGTDTNTIETGFDSQITPYFDSDEELITVDMDIDLTSLVAFRELVSVQGGESFSQPQTQDQTLNNIIRLKAGETALVGGLVYESVSSDQRTITPLESLKAADISQSRESNALFILMRPTVTVYQENQG